MPRMEHEKDGYTYACPACDCAPIYERVGRCYNGDPPEQPYRCETCGVELKYVIVRPKKQKGLRGQQKLTKASDSPTPARELEVKAPEDLGLEPIGVRGGSP